jgi:D-alanine-D-alanine ligase
MKVLVIYGGGSSEREASLRSGESVAAALEKAGYIVKLYDPHDDTSFSELKNLLWDVDVAFSIIHDGAVQTVLEQLKMPFVGSSSSVSAACLNKGQTLEKVRAAGVPTTDSALVTYDQLETSPLRYQSFVLKPAAEGASADTFLVHEPASFEPESVRPAFERYGSLLMESLIEGTEITVPVLGDKALPVIEIIPPEDKDNGQTQELCPPQHVSADLQKQAQGLALKVHKLMGCRDLSQTGIMIDGAGKLYFLEINTLPGMTNEDLFPKAAAVLSLQMQQLVDELIKMATSRQM